MLFALQPQTAFAASSWAERITGCHPVSAATGFLADMSLLAQTRIEAVNQAVQVADPGTGFPDMASVSTIVFGVTLLLGLFALIRIHAQRRVSDPHRLFVELCRGHQMSRAQRRLLKRVVRSGGITDPSQIMLHADLWGLEKTTWTSKQRQRLQVLQRVLFVSERPAVE